MANSPQLKDGGGTLKELPPEAERQLDQHKFMFRDDLEPLGGTVTGPALEKYRCSRP